jgi:hypothetical protein
MTHLEIAAMVATYALATTRLLKVTQPVWDKLPRMAQLVLPALLITLPQLGGALGLVETKLDLVEAIGQAVVAVLIASGGREGSAAKTAGMLLLLSFGSTACSSLREGERVGPFVGQAWRVDCAADTPESLHERYEYENPYYVCGEYMDLESCPAIWVHRYRYEWAKKEYRERCQAAT